VYEGNMGLFENDRETNLESTISMVEDALIELGHFVNDCRHNRPDSLRAWSLQKGSAQVILTLVDKTDFVHIIASATVLRVTADVDAPALMRRLLELNRELVGCAFTIDGDQVSLYTERSTLDLDRSEALELIRRVQSYADEYDDRLFAEFGGELGGAG
jgi:hypothetical protein